ncbi:MAG: hypothetical protein VSS75_023410 [Candidatus Parabeggiatoa sp.]|nr:hypothetical protein [Candidatus Parabeggiatoa sp.]
MIVKTTFNWLTWLVLLAVSSLLIPNAYAGNVLSAGTEHVCGIKDDSTLICWGDNQYNQADPPDGTFTQVSAGMNFNCALKTDASLACWGKDTAGETSPPPGQFIQVETGYQHACALGYDGVPICWGNNSSNQVDFLPGPFQQLALGDQHSCGLKIDGTVECWGNNSHGQSTPPAETTFSSIVAGYNTTCGIKTDHIAICWGISNRSYGYLTQIDFGLAYNSLCGLKTDNTPSCPSMSGVPHDEFTDVTIGASLSSSNDTFACGIKTDGLAACWGYNAYSQATPPDDVVFMQSAQASKPSYPSKPQPGKSDTASYNLFFTDLKPLYNIGETLEIDLVEKLQVSRFERVDLWVVIQMPKGSLLYVTPVPTNFLSLSPQPFQESLEFSEKTTRILTFEVIPGLGGEYSVYAAYVVEGKNPMTDSFLVLKSNIASVKVVLNNE